mmetsp:Transcript_11492/g.39962  ORF Transcript_11492/g.39962 Transcript_11492/m.39962 type:complete len:324 (-) Transcript_11492:450-1421(-)
MPRHAGRRDRVRAQRPRQDWGAQHGVRDGHPPPGGRVHAGGLHDAQGRHHAPRGAPHHPADDELHHSEALPERGVCGRAAPPQVRGEPEDGAGAGGEGAQVRGQGRDQPAHGDRGAQGPPVLRRVPVPPRVQVPPGEAVPALPGAAAGLVGAARPVRHQRQQRRGLGVRGARGACAGEQPPSRVHPWPRREGRRAPLLARLLCAGRLARRLGLVCNFPTGAVRLRFAAALLRLVRSRFGALTAPVLGARRSRCLLRPYRRIRARNISRSDNRCRRSISLRVRGAGLLVLCRFLVCCELRHYLLHGWAFRLCGLRTLAVLLVLV